VSQNDFDLANASGASYRADNNSALQALASRSSGATAPSTAYAHMLWVDTTNGVVKRRNAANSGWIVVETIDESFVLSRSSNTMLDLSDWGKTVRATGGYTQTFDAVATLGDGWEVDFRVESGVTLTLDPNSTETIDGATTLAVVGPARLKVKCNGSALYTVALDQPASDTVAGAIEIATRAEQETGTDTVRAVVPGRQHYHPSAAKAWLNAQGDGSGINASYNITSITDTATGSLGITIGTDFSSSSYVIVASSDTSNQDFALGRIVDATTASCLCYRSTTAVLTDPVRYHVAMFGVQA